MPQRACKLIIFATCPTCAHVDTDVRSSKVLDIEVRNLSITLQDADVWLYTASPERRETAGIVLGECRTLLDELEQVLDKLAALRPDPDIGSKREISHKIKRLWSSMKWDPEEIKGFQLRIISNIAKLNMIVQERIQVDVDCLVAHKDQQRGLSLSSLDIARLTQIFPQSVPKPSNGSAHTITQRNNVTFLANE